MANPTSRKLLSMVSRGSRSARVFATRVPLLMLSASPLHYRRRGRKQHRKVSDMNATLMLRNFPSELILELRELNTGKPIATINVDWAQIGEALAKGGLEKFPAH